MPNKNTFIIIAVLALVVLVLGVTTWVLSLRYKLQLKPETSDTLNWNVYRNEDYGFELKYPKFFTLTEDNKKDEIKIVYEVNSVKPYSDPCNFSDIETEELNKWTNFLIFISIVEGSLADAVRIKDPYLYETAYKNTKEFKDTENYGDDIKKVRINQLEGYRIYQGVEGCGFYWYFFPFDNKRVLVISRLGYDRFWSSFSFLFYQELIPDIFSSEQEDYFFNQILSTLKFIN